MLNQPDMQTLASLGTRVAVLGVGRYALPVRFRTHGEGIDCLLPNWSGVADLLDEVREVTLVAVGDSTQDLTWLFIRGTAAVLPAQGWEGLSPPAPRLLDPSDLYQLVRITPRRIELVDERRGWGWRETTDL